MTIGHALKYEMILKEYKCIDMTESHEIPTRAEQIQPRPQCLGWIAGRKEWEEGDRRLRYSSIRLRSDLIYANSGGGSVASADGGSIGGVLTILEYPSLRVETVSEHRLENMNWTIICG